MSHPWADAWKVVNVDGQSFPVNGYGPIRLMGVIISGNAGTHYFVKIYDAPNTTGSPIMVIKSGPTATTNFVSFGPSGVRVDNLSYTWSGGTPPGNTCYLFYLDD